MFCTYQEQEWHQEVSERSKTTLTVGCNVRGPNPMAKVAWIKKKEESQCGGNEKCVWSNHWFLPSRIFSSANYENKNKKKKKKKKVMLWDSNYLGYEKYLDGYEELRSCAHSQ